MPVEQGGKLKKLVRPFRSLLNEVLLPSPEAWRLAD